MKLENYKDRVNELIDLANKTIASKYKGGGSPTFYYVDTELFNQFRTGSLSFIIKLYEKTHPYYIDFDKKVGGAVPNDTEKGVGILKSIKSELDGGWLNSIKGIVSAEIFSNFLEMAEHLLGEKYKDPAAVMIGSVLEEHLRQLCIKNGISIDDNKMGKLIPKKADLLNAGLYSAEIYNKLDQKSITTWLDLRNKAAHGKYSDYNQQQVELMLNAVTEFITRNSI